jgi:hypothetical protein
MITTACSAGRPTRSPHRRVESPTLFYVHCGDDLSSHIAAHPAESRVVELQPSAVLLRSRANDLLEPSRAAPFPGLGRDNSSSVSVPRDLHRGAVDLREVLAGRQPGNHEQPPGCIDGHLRDSYIQHHARDKPALTLAALSRRGGVRCSSAAALKRHRRDPAHVPAPGSTRPADAEEHRTSPRASGVTTLDPA